MAPSYRAVRLEAGPPRRRLCCAGLTVETTDARVVPARQALDRGGDPAAACSAVYDEVGDGLVGVEREGHLRRRAAALGGVDQHGVGDTS